MIGLCFPGQGAQFVGMGADLAASYPVAADTFAEADEALGAALSQLCFEGPLEDLTETAVCQPAILAVCVAALRAAREVLDIDAGVAFGHSLGEYAALVAAGAIDFPTALKVVAERGAAMQAAADTRPGGMVALIGIDDDAAAAMCERAGGVWPANYNSPGQVVASGELAGVERLLELASTDGVRAMRLQVSGAFHSPLMEDAAVRVGEALAEWQPQVPEIAFLSTTTCAEEPPEAMRDVLVSQLTSPVRFSETVRVARERGVERFIEVGPGSVLAGLIRRIDRAAETMSLGTSEQLEAAAAAGHGSASEAPA